MTIITIKASSKLCDHTDSGTFPIMLGLCDENLKPSFSVMDRCETSSNIAVKQSWNIIKAVNFSAVLLYLEPADDKICFWTISIQKRECVVLLRIRCKIRCS